MTRIPLPDSVTLAGTGALHGCDNFQWADRTRFVTGIFLAMAKALVEHDREEARMTLGEWKKANVQINAARLAAVRRSDARNATSDQAGKCVGT